MLTKKKLSGTVSVHTALSSNLKCLWVVASVKKICLKCQNFQITMSSNITNIESKSFEMGGGGRQGDPMSPLLFICALDEFFRNLNWKTKRIKFNGDLQNNLRFADDVVLVVGCWDNLQAMLEELSCQSRSAGVEMNMSKLQGDQKVLPTKILRVLFVSTVLEKYPRYYSQLLDTYLRVSPQFLRYFFFQLGTVALAAGKMEVLRVNLTPLSQKKKGEKSLLLR